MPATTDAQRLKYSMMQGLDLLFWLARLLLELVGRLGPGAGSVRNLTVWARCARETAAQLPTRAQARRAQAPRWGAPTCWSQSEVRRCRLSLSALATRHGGHWWTRCGAHP